MKVCEVFRTKWETMFSGWRNEWMLLDVLSGVTDRQAKHPKESLNYSFFISWNENVCYYLTASDLKQYSVSADQIGKAIENGFICYKEYNNYQTRAGLTHSKQWRLTAKGKKALYSAYEKWSFEKA